MRRWVAVVVIGAAGAWAGCAWAAEDCAPAGHLPTYEAADPPDGRSYNAVAFPVQRGGATETVTVTGSTCLQHYAPQDSTDPLSDLEIQMNYRQQLRETGADILFGDAHSTTARRMMGGEETWVHVASQETAIDVVVVRRQSRAQVLTPPGPTDYRLIGHMPDYVTDKPDSRAFDQRVFTTRDGDDTKDVTVQGKRYEIDYTLRDGARLASDLDIQENYRVGLQAAGAQILFTDDHDTVARIERDGRAIWLKVWSEETAINVTVIEQALHAEVLTAADGDDYPLLGHMPDYVTSGPPEKRGFDELTFVVQDGAEPREVKVQGTRYEVAYAPREGANPASDLDIQLNYRTALAGLGAQVLFTDAGNTVARLQAAGQTVWVKIWSQETAIGVSVIEEKPFQASIVAATAAGMKRALEKKGRAILRPPFVLGKAALKPEAAGPIGEVVRMLKDDPTLSLVIEDHTDDVGGHDTNMKLSEARAQSVVAALVAAGIAPGRLTARGLGAEKPIDDNATSEGRARNRRVELVKA